MISVDLLCCLTAWMRVLILHSERKGKDAVLHSLMYFFLNIYNIVRINSYKAILQVRKLRVV